MSAFAEGSRTEMGMNPVAEPARQSAYTGILPYQAIREMVSSGEIKAAESLELSKMIRYSLQASTSALESLRTQWTLAFCPAAEYAFWPK